MTIYPAIINLMLFLREGVFLLKYIISSLYAIYYFYTDFRCATVLKEKIREIRYRDDVEEKSKRAVARMCNRAAVLAEFPRVRHAKIGLISGILFFFFNLSFTISSPGGGYRAGISVSPSREGGASIFAGNNKSAAFVARSFIRAEVRNKCRARARSRAHA